MYIGAFCFSSLEEGRGEEARERKISLVYPELFSRAAFVPAFWQNTLGMASFEHGVEVFLGPDCLFTLCFLLFLLSFSLLLVWVGMLSMDGGFDLGNGARLFSLGGRMH